MINHHAHLEFITLHPETGKSTFRASNRTRKGMSAIQDFVAKELGMIRGDPKYDVKDDNGNVIKKGTGRNHIPCRQYKKAVAGREKRNHAKYDALRAEIKEAKERSKQIEADLAKEQQARHTEHKDLSDLAHTIQQAQNTDILDVFKVGTDDRRVLTFKESKQIVEAWVRLG
ncbi:hypothetical protein NHP20013_13460 [Helicobacter bizzozeronii]|nr:hypothetical protein NHP20013_13460 [Helicobacter bizzozeronii]